jgi:thioredoxin 2
VPQEKIAQGHAPICGRCKNPLPVSAKPVVVTDATFATEVERSSLPVLLDLWAQWCGPCHIIAPAIEQLATELAGRVRVAKLNIDENPKTAARFDVRSIPTLLVLKNGREVDRIVGAQPKVAIMQRLQKVI